MTAKKQQSKKASTVKAAKRASNGKKSAAEKRSGASAATTAGARAKRPSVDNQVGPQPIREELTTEELTLRSFRIAYANHHGKKA